MEELLQWMEYTELRNGPATHDTIHRMMGMISLEIFQQLYGNGREEIINEEKTVCNLEEVPDSFLY